MAASVHRLGPCTAAAAWGDLLAISSPDNKVVIYQRSGGQRLAELEGHEDTITGLYFAARAAAAGGSGSPDEAGRAGPLRLVSSSHDRNSFVWTQQLAADAAAPTSGGTATASSTAGSGQQQQHWQPELVITKLRKAGLCVACAPSGLKFAIGSSDRTLDVVCLDADRELWAPKLVRNRHESAVMAVTWHPSGAVLATASTDSKLRLFNAMVPDVDGRLSLAALAGSRFGECLLQLPLPGGWGLAAAFSPAGDTLAVASQASQMTLLTGLDLQDPASLALDAAAIEAVGAAAAPGGRLQHLQLPGLPLKCLTFLSDSFLVGGGFDFQPAVFARQSDGQWQFVRSLQGVKPDSSSKAGPAQPTSMSARIKMFEQQAAAAAATSSRPAAGPAGAAAAGTGPGPSKSSGGAGGSSGQQSGPHANCIISIAAVPGPPGMLGFLTASLEGCIAEWHLDPATLLQP